MSLERWINECSDCTRCELCKTRTNTVFGVGPENSPIMFVGEGPGRQEDEQGEPFVGAAGQLLDEMLSIIDLGRNNCYITNIVKCRPPQNRDPSQDEQQSCLPFLRVQFKQIRPKIIICLGRISAGVLIHEDYRITKEHGTWVEKNGVFLTATYHPSALLRDLNKRPEAFNDLLSIREKILAVCPDFYSSFGNEA